MGLEKSAVGSQKKLILIFVSERNSKLRQWTDRIAEMKLDFTGIKQYFILYSVE
jgi:hypothetical protein